jgi:hypothetical protein
VCPTSPPMRPGRYVLRGRSGDNRPNDCVSYPVASTTHDDIIMECNDNREDSDIPSNNFGEPNRYDILICFFILIILVVY